MSATFDEDDMITAGPLAALAFLARPFRRRPGDTVGLGVAVAATAAVLINALYLQSGPHPAPIFSAKSRPVTTSGDSTGSVVTVVAPRPRPADLGATRPDAPAGARSHADVVGDIQRELERRGFYEGAVDGVDGPRTDAAIRDFAQAAGIKWNGDRTEDLLRTIVHSSAKARGTATAAAGSAAHGDAIGDLIATSSRRVLAVQRALADFGFGPVKPNGVFGVETKTAIEKFERDRKLPVTGQISDRLMRELAAVTGRPLE